MSFSLNRYLFIALLGTVFIGYNNVHAQNGFVVWSSGGGCAKRLVFNKIENGKVGEMNTAVEKHIADIWVQISYDGVWIAFCRTNEAFKGKYGDCDYHLFDKWDIYIAKIDNGKSLPATPIKIAHGYLPSWGDDAYNPVKSKTLYFTHYESKTIKKTMISPDGTFTPPEEYHRFDQEMGTRAHIQMSPNGKFLLYRPSGMKVYSLELETDISEDLGGCQPSWGPRSRYFIRSKNRAFLNTGTSVKKLGFSGLDGNWQNFSNDSWYDEGKLWVIGIKPHCVGLSSDHRCLVFREVDISNEGWKLGEYIKVGIFGTSCDIHIRGPEKTPVKSSYFPNNFCRGIVFNARVRTGTDDLQLTIESFDPAYSVGLYDMKGRQTALLSMQDKSQTIIPLHGIENGIYLIQLNTAQGSIRKTIRIIR